MKDAVKVAEDKNVNKKKDGYIEIIGEVAEDLDIVSKDPTYLLDNLYKVSRKHRGRS